MNKASLTREQDVAHLLSNSKSTVFLGGAGVSTESGIPDFRSETGLYSAQQVYGYGKEGDVFLGISTSGNAKNVLYAAGVARAKKLKVIALTGADGGKLKSFADVCICVPETETYKIQELHLPVYHLLCLMLEEHFF